MKKKNLQFILFCIIFKLHSSFQYNNEIIFHLTKILDKSENILNGKENYEIEELHDDFDNLFTQYNSARNKKIDLELYSLLKKNFIHNNVDLYEAGSYLNSIYKKNIKYSTNSKNIEKRLLIKKKFEEFEKHIIKNNWFDYYKNVLSKNTKLLGNKITHDLTGYIYFFMIYIGAIKIVEKIYGLFDFKPIKKDTSITFKSIGGYEHIKNELSLVIDSLKHPSKYKDKGARLPRGMILHGPPGTGKSFIAKAIANEANVPLFVVSVSNIKSKFHGDTEKNIKNLFTTARRTTPCIIFLDEIDSIAKKRELNHSITHELNVLLEEIDCYENNNGIFVIGATNLIETIDPALRRSGRLEMQFLIDLPDRATVKKIVETQLQSKYLQLENDVTLNFIAEKMNGLSPAQIEDFFNRILIQLIHLNEHQENKDYVKNNLIDIIKQFFFKNNSKKIYTLNKKLFIEELKKFKDSKAYSDITKFTPIKPDKSINFQSLGGFEEIKKELSVVIDCLKNKEKYEDFNIRIPRGMILYGPPGTGKTHIVKAFASEAEVRLFVINCSDIKSKWIGESEKNIHDLFEKARSVAPCIIFFDEIDAIAPNREKTFHSDANGQLNILLEKIDGFNTKNNGIFIVGATNLIENVDHALIRSGRLELHFEVPLPNIESRKDIITKQLTIKKLLLEETISIDDIAFKTYSFSAADIEALINRCGIQSKLHNNNNIITQKIFDTVFKDIAFGLKNDLKISQKDLEITAYHELGHLFTSMYSKHQFIIDSITIEPRSKALGMNHFIVEDDFSTANKEQLEAIIITSLGGMAAEKIFTQTSGAGVSSDLEKAKQIAKTMIKKYGMGESIYLNSEEIENNTKKIIDSCYKTSYDIIQKYKEIIEKIKITLIEKKTMSRKEILYCIKNNGGNVPEKYKNFI